MGFPKYQLCIRWVREKRSKLCSYGLINKTQVILLLYARGRLMHLNGFKWKL